MIIDGVDVSGFKYFDCGYKECKAEYYVRYGYEIEKYDSCRENPNCYYKQLKRKEQELADLKEFCEKLKKSNSNYATAVLKRNLKLKKIKDIATDLLPLTNEYDNCYYKDNCNKCDKECQYKFVDKMLQIIEGK